MKHDWIGLNLLPQVEVLATFGGAEIVKYLDGKLEITARTPSVHFASGIHSLNRAASGSS